MDDINVKEISGMFDGPVKPLLIKLALPMFAGMIVQVLYNVIDTFWVSRIDLSDPSFMGGTSIVFPLIFFFIALGNGLMVGTSSLVARAVGKRNVKVLSSAAESGFVISLFLSILSLAVIYPFAPKLLVTLGARGDYYVHGLEYILYITPAAPAIFFGYILFGILQGEGLMKYVMNGMLIGTILNIVLDPLFIFGFDMDVRGAAIATTISEYIAMFYAFTVFLRKKSSIHIRWSLKNIKLHTMRDIVSIGFPQSAAQIIMSFSFIIFNNIVIRIDEMALTAFGLCGRFEQIMLMPAFAIGSALVTIVGQNAGRGNFKRVRDTVHQAWLLGFIAVGAITVVMVGFAPQIFKPFTDVDKVLWYAVTQYRILGIGFLCAVVGIIGRCFFQGIGYALPAFLITMLRLLLIALPVMLILIRVFDLGIYGVWIGLVSASFFSMLISLFWVKYTIGRLESGKMQIHHV